MTCFLLGYLLIGFVIYFLVSEFVLAYGWTGERAQPAWLWQALQILLWPIALSACIFLAARRVVCQR